MAGKYQSCARCFIVQLTCKAGKLSSHSGMWEPLGGTSCRLKSRCDGNFIGSSSIDRCADPMARCEILDAES